MTLEEFGNQRWGGNMKAIYRGHEYEIGSVIFPEAIIGLVDSEDDYIWARCENVELVQPDI